MTEKSDQRQNKTSCRVNALKSSIKYITENDYTLYIALFQYASAKSQRST